MKTQLSVFISYASEDHEEAADLAFYLGHDGFDPWIDRDELLPGQDGDLELKKAIRDCHAAIVCLSNSSINKRGYLQKEIREVLDVAQEIPEGQVFVIPVRFENCPIPESLRTLQWVNLFEAGGYEKLRQVLKLRAKALGIRTKSHLVSTDLTGLYAAEGTNDDHTQYAGVALISCRGGDCTVTWRIEKDRFQAQGLLKRRKLSVKGDFNFTYSIRSDGTLFEEWEPSATETLTRIPPNSRFINSPIGRFGRVRRRQSRSLPRAPRHSP
jgi:TIR domain